MRILVTGASGFIGRHLVSALSDRYEVFAAVRDPLRVGFNGRANVLDMDLAGPLDMKVLPARLDVIVHLAQANVSFPESANELWAVNTGSTQHLLDYARRVGARRFILASTGDVYGRRFGPCKESDPVAATSYYALTKQAAELLTQAYTGYLETSILRLFHPYGPDQSDRLIPRLADAIRQGKAIQLNQDDRPRLTPIYVGDVVMAIALAVDSSGSGVVHIAGDRVVSVRELAEEIGGVLESKPLFEETNEESADMIGGNELMKQMFGAWPMIALADGLSRTLKGKR